MKFLSTIVLCLLTFILHASPSDILIDALVHVESRGYAHAVGDNGRAVGCLQIHKAVVDDVNRHYGTSYTYGDRRNIVKSREICRKYLLMYGGHDATNEKYARIWNGGPNGHTNHLTIKYWNRVRSQMFWLVVIFS